MGYEEYDMGITSIRPHTSGRIIVSLSPDVTRLKSNAAIQVVESYLTDERKEHLLIDEEIQLIGVESKERYPDTLRVVPVWNSENKIHLHLLINNFTWTADTIS